uniref:NPHS1 adhesion molecule, nephrin n=1 Tax=Terrapene triunguis TaxID=2587831 RepID=A0A674J4E7_9SAUR
MVSKGPVTTFLCLLLGAFTRGERTSANVLWASTQQAFTVEPNNITVLEGAVAILQCVVDNPSGVVQWVKDGLLLGPDTNIPSFPRYSMTGDPSKGEHHLRIVDSRLADDGDYECQAGRSKESPGIVSHTALLSVLVPPKTPVFKEYEANSTVTWVAGVEYMVTCSAGDAKPAAEISFSKGDPLAGPTDSPPRWQDMALLCHKGVPLSTGCARVPPQPILVSSPPVPPQPPTIEGYKRPEIKAGETLKLICISLSGNPLATLQWLKNGNVVSTSWETEDASGASRSLLTLSIKPEDNGAQLRCEAMNQVSPLPLVASVTLRVVFLPTEVSILGSSSTPENKQISLSCSTTPSNPPVQLRWWLGWRELTTTEVTVTKGKLGGAGMTVSNLTHMARREENGLPLTCEAFNEVVLFTRSTSLPLSVKYPPQKVWIEAPHPDSRFRAGTKVRLTCFASGGNPAPRLVWIKVMGGAPGHGELSRGRCAARSGVGGSAGEAVLRRVGRGAQRGGLCCEEWGGELSCSTVLRAVGWGAQWGAVSLWNETHPSPEPYPWGEGERGGLYTRRSQVNPPLKGTAPALGGDSNAPRVTRQQVLGDPVYVDLGATAELVCVANANPILAGMFQWTWLVRGGVSAVDLPKASGAVGRLRIRGARQAQAGLYECRVDNGLPPPARGSARLIVRFKPEIEKGMGLGKVAMPGDGSSPAILLCRAQGVPSVQFSWAKNGAALSTLPPPPRYTERTWHEGTWHSSTLTIANVSAMHDYATFTCRASNALGTDKLDIQLLSTSPPDPPTGLKVVSVTHNSATLEWIPGFDGGLPQRFLIRYRWPGAPSALYMDVFPAQTSAFTLTGLSPATPYSIGVSAHNTLGESGMGWLRGWRMGPQVFPLWRMLAPGRSLMLSFAFPEAPSLPPALIGGLSALGALLLLSNAALLVCLLRRRQAWAGNSPPPWTGALPLGSSQHQMVANEAQPGLILAVFWF